MNNIENRIVKLEKKVAQKQNRVATLADLLMFVGDNPFDYTYDTGFTEEGEYEVDGKSLDQLDTSVGVIPALAALGNN